MVVFYFVGCEKKMQMYEKKLNELRVGIVFLIEIEKPGEESPLQPSSLSIYQVAENGYDDQQIF